MNDWVNCLRLVAFGQQQQPLVVQPSAPHSQQQRVSKRPDKVDILLEKRGPLVSSAPVAATGPLPKKLPPSTDKQPEQPAGGRITTASQAVAAANSALAKSRQRQPSLLGTCKPQPPTDSPFIQKADPPALVAGQLDTLTPAMRGQLLAGSATLGNRAANAGGAQRKVLAPVSVQATLDEEEENMLYCSIEDNPSEHNYRVKVIETELSLRCQLKCYQLTAPTTISQQYEQIGNFDAKSGAYNGKTQQDIMMMNQPPPVTFYQLIIGPQELTLLNDYAISSHKLASQGLLQQQGLWSWPYQCIRRYGFDKDNCFMFEAGRKCTSGPGQFIVQTPKAYNIYQDVVKFVNELRSLSNQQVCNESATKPAAADGSAADAGQKSITQIPVTWTPNSNTTSELAPDSPQDPRQQFFNTLRQIDNNSTNESGGNKVALTATKETEPDPKSLDKASRQLSTSSPDSVGTQPGANNSDSRNARQQQKCSDLSEETDESGYDHGDDSVKESGKPKCKSVANSAGANRKRSQMNDESMSSSSSTNSSDGSPGHSVSRRSMGSVGFGPFQKPTNGQVNRRTPLITHQKLEQQLPPSSPAKTGLVITNTKIDQTANNNNNNNNDKNLSSRMHNLLLNDCLDRTTDFETSLIRDVYSEITKLHAEFAITTTHSTEDSMSSSSGSDRLGQDEDGTNDSDFGTSNPAQAEPMYSNLKFPRARHLSQVNERPAESDGRNRRGDTQHHQNQFQHHAPPDGSYTQQHQDSYDYSCSRQMYPSILNPIPECGEPQWPVVRRPAHDTGRSTTTTQGFERCKLTGHSGQSNLQLRSRLQTNHYVINDVQYAKISKNICSKY